MWWAVCFAAAAWAGTSDDAVRSITAALRAKNYQQASQLAEAACREWPQEIRILVLRGMALSGLGKDAEAIASFNGALKISPEYVPALEAVSQLEYQKGGSGAIEHLERLLALRPNEETAHAMLAVLEWRKGDCSAAVPHFARAQSEIASQAEALYGYGACLMKLRRAADAVAVFRQLAQSHPEERRARYALAVGLLTMKQPREALKELDAMVQANDATALELASSAHESLGETPEAVAMLREAIVREPDNIKLYLDFAALSFTHQSFQVGIDVINAGLTRSPQSAQLYLARGVLYVQLAQFDRADQDFDRAERLDPKQAFSGVVRGLSQIQQNNLDEALATVRSQLKERPKDEFLHYVLAELLSKQGAQPGSPQFDEAVHAALEAVRLKPDFTLAHDVLSRLYAQTGDTAKVMEHCRTALRYDPNDEMAVYRLMRALQSTGTKEAAEEVPILLKRFSTLREEARKREAEEGKYRLVEESRQ